jgi:hypothetical protein
MDDPDPWEDGRTRRDPPARHVTSQSIRRAVVHPGRAREIIGRSLSEVNLGSETSAPITGFPIDVAAAQDLPISRFRASIENLAGSKTR